MTDKPKSRRVQRRAQRTCSMCIQYLDLFRAITDNYRSKAEACRKRGWADMADSCADMAGIVDRLIAKTSNVPAQAGAVATSLKPVVGGKVGA